MSALSLQTAERIVAAAQAADAAAFVALLTPDVTFRLGSSPELRGREAVRAAVRQLFDSVGRIRHTTQRLAIDGNRIFLQADVEFARKQGGTVTLPYVNVLTVESGELIGRYLIHIDIAPLFGNHA
jgi:uncharacterized protein (TIGR02246 family)